MGRIKFTKKLLKCNREGVCYFLSEENLNASSIISVESASYARCSRFRNALIIGVVSPYEPSAIEGCRQGKMCNPLPALGTAGGAGGLPTTLSQFFNTINDRSVCLPASGKTMRQAGSSECFSRNQSQIRLCGIPSSGTCPLLFKKKWEKEPSCVWLPFLFGRVPLFGIPHEWDSCTEDPTAHDS